MMPSAAHDPQRLVAALKGALDQAGFGAHVHTAAVAVLLALGLIAIARATTTGEGRQLLDTLIRLGLAAWAVESAPAASAHAARLFASFSSGGFQALGALVGRPALEGALREFAGAAEDLTAALIGGQTAGGAMGHLPASSMLPRVADTVGALAHRGLAIIGVGMGLLFAAYYALSFWSRMILMVSSLLAPLSFACLAHPRTDHLAWLWVRATLRACLTIFLGNLVLAAAVYLGILRPLEEFRQAAPMERLAQLALPIPAIAALGFGVIALLKVEGVAAGWIEAGAVSVRDSVLAVVGGDRAGGVTAPAREPGASGAAEPGAFPTEPATAWGTGWDVIPRRRGARDEMPLPEPLFPPPGGSRWL